MKFMHACPECGGAMKKVTYSLPHRSVSTEKECEDCGHTRKM